MQKFAILNYMKIHTDGQQIEQVREFLYLGSLISDDGYCEKEIASRIGMAKKVFPGQKEVIYRENESGTKEKNRQFPGLVCSNERSGNMDFKRSRQDEDRSLRNVDLETTGEDQLER